jgi:UDP-GlcNAc:undecaprenyl-phosphate GlcNAc-1-phosphate transferase
MAHRFPLDASLIAVAAFVAAAIATPVVRAFARRFGCVAMPKSDRWHRQPTAMLGGVAIFVAVMATGPLMVRLSREGWVVLGASTLLFLVGLVDDFLHIKPYQKLIGQVAGAGVVIYFGLVLPWTASATMNMTITLIWLIGITNAVNMLDNMDGLSAGTAAIAAAFLGINFAINGQWNEAVLLAGFAAALLGFLVYNHSPASIFMGDGGSLFIGFFLASAALLSGTGGGRSRSVVAVLAVPVLVLCVPIFDTTFVTLMRKLAGRAASQGGRDHTSHRLVALGLTEKHAVWMLYALALSAGSLALLVRHAATDVTVVAITTFTVVLTFIGVHLGRVHVYDEEEILAAREKPVVSFLFDLSYKRRVFEVLLDVVLISVAYYLAYALKFGPINSTSNWQLFLHTLPVVVVVKLGVFLLTGIYRGLWRYASLASVADFARAVVVSSIAAILAIVFVFRFDGFSRTVFALDAILLLMAVTASRFGFRMLRRLIPAPQTEATKRVVIYGAGDGGELVYRELRNNLALAAVPVAFIDDDPAKRGRVVHGLRVYSAAGGLSALCRSLNAQEVLISTQTISRERLRMIVGECAASDIAVAFAHMTIQTLSPGDLGWIFGSDTATYAAPLISAHGDASLLHLAARPGVNTNH